MKENNQNLNYNENETVQDEIMNRVNQTFDKISEDVKSMISENKHNNLQ
jgi:hypothetical protein